MKSLLLLLFILIGYSDLWEWDGKKWTQVEKGKTYKWDMQKDMFVNTQ